MGAARRDGPTEQHIGARDKITNMTLDEKHAVLIVSFGGPRGHDDVMPFLRTVTAGVPVPQERLELVAEHYHARGGRSPINDQTQRLADAIKAELRVRGEDLPLAVGNRNWTPWISDGLDELRRAGAERLTVVVTSAYSSYSGCRKYRENLATALQDISDQHGWMPHVEKIVNHHTLVGWREAWVDHTRSAISQADSSTRVLFVTHSIPTAMAASSGCDNADSASEGAYVQQHKELADYVIAQCESDLLYELVYCSRSGPASQPWLEPDICDRIDELAAEDVKHIICVPIGFMSDHMEVIQDLDTAAREAAFTHEMDFTRVPTPDAHPAVVRGIVDRIVNQDTTSCGDNCCPNLRNLSTPALGDTSFNIKAGH